MERAGRGDHSVWRRVQRRVAPGRASRQGQTLRQVLPCGGAWLGDACTAARVWPDRELDAKMCRATTLAMGCTTRASGAAVEDSGKH